MRSGGGALLFVLLGCAQPEKGSPPSAASSATNATTTAKAIDPNTAVVFAAGPRRVTLAELARVMGPPPQQRLRMTEHERRLAFLGEFERTELFALAAQSRGYFDDPALQRARRAQLVQRLLEDLFGPNGSQLAPVTPADIKTYYDAHAERWNTPERVRARHILVHDARRAAAVLAQIKARPMDPSLFAKLAHEQSLDARTRERGGDLGRFTLALPPPPAADVVTSASMTPPVVPESVRSAAFLLAQPGDVSPTPIKSELGYHVVQLLGREPPGHVELRQVEHILGEQLRDERQTAAIEAFAKALEAQAHLQVNEAALAHVLLGT